MKNRIAAVGICLGCGVVALHLPTLAAADGPRRDGRWEMTMQMSMPGLPKQPPPMTFTQCLDGKRLVPQDPSRKGECRITEQNVEGSTVTWKVQCAKGEGSGTMTFGAGAVDGAVTMKVTMRSGQVMEAVETIHGVRKGDCKK